MFVVAFGCMVFGIHEKTDPARRIENLDELSHCRDQQGSPKALPLMFPGDGQPSKPHTGHLTRQLPGFFR